MALELERECPTCETTRTFYRAASTRLHLGEKVKWRCGDDDCDHAVVRIDGDIDSDA